MNSWRPDNWKNPYSIPAVSRNLNTLESTCEAGADAMLEALRKRFGIFSVEDDDEDMKAKIAKSNAVGMGLIEEANDERI